MPHSQSYRRILHRMGYYNYQQGLIYRHLIQDKGWISHEERCRSFILKAIDYYKPEKVTVLGSGWLLELPLAEMAELVRTIILTDIVHPPEVIEQTSGLKNVKIAEEDVTGGLIGEVWNKTRRRTFFNKLNTLSGILIPEYEPVEEPGLVLSMNILTQMESLPEKLLRKKTRAGEAEYLDFRKEIQSRHLQFLKRHKSVLITDLAEVFTEAGGKTYEINTMLTELPPGKVKEEWIWNFDLKGSDFSRKRSVFKVGALIL